MQTKCDLFILFKKKNNDSLFFYRTKCIADKTSFLVSSKCFAEVTFNLGFSALEEPVVQSMGLNLGMSLICQGPVLLVHSE